MDEELQTQLADRRAKIETDFFDLSIREIVRMVESDELIIRPEYQRKFRWKEPVQSALIESLLLGLPIPAIFVAANKNATWELVDGLQRVATLIRFMSEPEIRSRHLKSLGGRHDRLVLSELQELSQFNSLGYTELPRPIQFTIEKRFIRIQVLSDGSDPSIRYQLFKRLNQGAMKLEPQEIRECVYRGRFSDLIRELARDTTFRRLLKLRASDETNGTPEEVVLKFFAYLENPDLPNNLKFTHSVEGFLNDYMEARSDLPDAELSAKRDIFERTCAELNRIVAGPVLRPGNNVTPLNLFEAVLVGAARTLSIEKSLKVPHAGWLNDSELVRHSTKGTNTPRALEGRIARAAQLLA